MLRLTSLLAAVFTLVGPAFSAPTPQMPPGMKIYQFVFLRPGPNKEVPPAKAKELQQAHLEGLMKLNRERVNLLFGPVTEAGDLRGIVVLDVPDAAAAQKVLADDPYIKAGHMVAEVKPWLCETNHFFMPIEPPTPEPLVLGFLMRAPNPPQLPAEESAKLQTGHLDYMKQLHQQGKLLIAGPFGESSDWRGMVIYRVGSVAEAKELAAGDPTVKAGRLKLDAHPWMTFKGILK
jgi:uncharacterized protein YciI